MHNCGFSISSIMPFDPRKPFDIANESPAEIAKAKEFLRAKARDEERRKQEVAAQKKAKEDREFQKYLEAKRAEAARKKREDDDMKKMAANRNLWK